MKKFTAFALSSALSFGVMSAEADHFTTHGMNIPDMAEIVNAKANTYLQKAVNDLNTQGACNQGVKSEKVLYKELTKYFANHFKGELVKDMLYTDEVFKVVTSIQDSIYSEWDMGSGMLLGRRNAGDATLAIYPITRIGDQNVGIDKFEHMFGMGQLYFFAHHIDGDSLDNVLRMGVLKEKFLLGGNMMETGVFAYGDLAANFNGMRFWNHMLQKRDDVMGKEYNVGPYVSCVDGKWVKNEEHPIDFRNYIDASYDESINCSRFATKSGFAKFQKALRRLNFISFEDQSACPLKPEVLEEMVKKYSVGIEGNKDGKTLASFMINKKGADVTSLVEALKGN